jgi:hypothetical protein
MTQNGAHIPDPWRKTEIRSRQEMQVVKAVATGFGVGALAALAAFVIDVASRPTPLVPAPVAAPQLAQVEQVKPAPAHASAP